MFDVGGPELLVIILAIIVLFGPEKIPEFTQLVGKGMQKVRQAQSQFQSQLQDIQDEVNKVAYPTSIESEQVILPIESDNNLTKPPKEESPKTIKDTDNISDNMADDTSDDIIQIN